MKPLIKPRWLLILTLLLAGAAGGQELGRLFLIPAERAHLERLRILANQPLPAVQEESAQEVESTPPPAAPPEEIIFSYSGSMQRGDGSLLIWLNNRPFSRDELPDNVAVLAPAARGHLRITNPETGQAFIVRPGQVLNLTRGELFEAYQVHTSGSAASRDQGAAQ